MKYKKSKTKVKSKSIKVDKKIPIKKSNGITEKDSIRKGKSIKILEFDGLSEFGCETSNYIFYYIPSFINYNKSQSLYNELRIKKDDKTITKLEKSISKEVDFSTIFQELVFFNTGDDGTNLKLLKSEYFIFLSLGEERKIEFSCGDDWINMNLFSGSLLVLKSHNKQLQYRYPIQKKINFGKFGLIFSCE